MFVGTGSDVGKSVMAAAFCRILRQDGYSPAPFKAQNMALNSYATPEGLEIGRAQAVQAEAAGVPCHTDMNPILLKPQSDRVAQVVLNGRPIGNRDAYQYFNEQGRDELRLLVNSAFDRLSHRYNPIVLEGAGSISEINLRDKDLVNMSMAIYAGADVFLIADIDRGGVFASLYGSVLLLNEEERKHIKGIIINKFRGDLRLFEPGVKLLEQLCKVPVIGVIPYFKDIFIEEEDSMNLMMKWRKAAPGKVNVAVILLRHLSNFTDFNMIERDPRVHLFYTDKAEELEKADVILIPGSKNTMDDLREMRSNGVAQALIQAHDRGTAVMGICGGFQMMGEELLDPCGVEGEIERMPGLGLLPVSTVLTKKKTTRQVRFRRNTSEVMENAGWMEGYEIHVGRTHILDREKAAPLNVMENGDMEGVMVSEKCMGSYIHGILDNPEFVEFLLHPYREKWDGTKEVSIFDYHKFKEEQYDKLADFVRRHINMELVYKILEQ